MKTDRTPESIANGQKVPPVLTEAAVAEDFEYPEDLIEAAGGIENVPRYLTMEAAQIREEFEFADDCGYPFTAHLHPTESGKGKTWACPALSPQRTRWRDRALRAEAERDTLRGVLAAHGPHGKPGCSPFID